MNTFQLLIKKNSCIDKKFEDIFSVIRFLYRLLCQFFRRKKENAEKLFFFSVSENME